MREWNIPVRKRVASPDELRGIARRLEALLFPKEDS